MCEHRVEDLVTGSIYRFRLRAVNAVGKGAWSPWTADMLLNEDCIGDPFNDPNASLAADDASAVSSQGGP